MDVFKYKGKNEIEIPVEVKAGTEDFIRFYRIKLLCGRNILPSDSLKEVLINEACAKAMGLSSPEEALGKFLYSGNNKAFPVAGVVTDFQIGSFHEKIKPVIIGNMQQWETNIAVKLSAQVDKSINAKNVILQNRGPMETVISENRLQLYFPRSIYSGTFRKGSADWLAGCSRNDYYNIHLVYGIVRTCYVHRRKTHKGNRDT